MSEFDSDPKAPPAGGPVVGPAASPFTVNHGQDPSLQPNASEDGNPTSEEPPKSEPPPAGSRLGEHHDPSGRQAPWQGTLERASEERFSAATTHPIEIDQIKEWAESAKTDKAAKAADAVDDGDHGETSNPSSLFAQPSTAGKKLEFAEDSENIPAPAPFDIAQVGAAAAEPATAPASDVSTPHDLEEAARRLTEFQEAETVEIQTVDPEALPSPPPLSSSPVSSMDLPAPARASEAPRPPSPDVQTTPPPYQGPPAADRRLALAIDVMARLRARMRAQILGRDEVIDLVLVALLADGHVLLEDFPGSGKTTLAKSLGSSIIDQLEAEEIADFRRIQFTPDLLPSDVTGVSIFDVTTNQFQFRRGPIFAHVVLADEINRTSPKVQSAMLEAMAEKQVTIDNVTYALDDLFFVIATQNPLDLAGTYPLPVAQLDRFLFKIRMDHIDRHSELEVLNTYRQRRDMERQDLPKVTRLDVLAARKAIDEHVAIDPPIKECLVDIAHTLRDDERVLQGNSTRSLVLMLPALQAMAALRGRDFVSSEDIQALIPRVLGHRVELAPGVNDIHQVLTEVMEGPIEALSRSTLRRGR